jgi:serine/threonine protein phosphatase PrpC
VREENQDRISRFRSSFGEVFVVADGVGGYQGGAQAAEMVINGLETHLRELPVDTPPAQALQEAARRTSAEIHQRAHSGDPATANMGATGVLALLAGWRIRVGHAGDCRAYLLRGDELIRLTRDHSRIQQMLERNLLSEEEARDHPDANIVTRAFGKETDLTLEVSEPFDLQSGDLLLLASDGLCGYVDDAAIRAALFAGGDAQEIADRLIGLSLAAGGEDNVSVQVIILPGSAARAAALPLPATSQVPATAPGGRRPLVWGIVATLFFLAFLAGWRLPWSRWIETGKERWRGEDPAVQTNETEKKKRETERKEQERRMAPVPDGERSIPDDEGDFESSAPAEPEIQISIHGGDATEPLRRLIGGVAHHVLPGKGKKPQGFPRGRVYFRDQRHQAEADELSQELNKGAKRNRRYLAKPWPKDLLKTLPEIEILVVPWKETPPAPSAPSKDIGKKRRRP